MKRLLSLVLALMLCASLVPLAASAETDLSAYEPDPNKVYEISVANYMLAPLGDEPVVKELIEEKFNVKLDIWYLDDSKWDELMSVRLSGGEVPDWFRIRKVDQLPTYVNQGVLAELPVEVIEKYAPTIAATLNEFSPGILDSGRVDGVQYALPAASASNAIHIPLVYRQDWMEKLGVTSLPTTLDEFVDLMYRFANEDPDGNGVKDTYGLSQDGMQAIYGAYGLVIDPDDYYFVERDGQVVDCATAPEFKEALALMRQMYADGVIDPEFITGENTGGYWALSHSFIQGRIGFSCRGNYYHWAPTGAFQVKNTEGEMVDNDPGAIAKEIELVNPDAKLGFGPALVNEDGQGGIKMYNSLKGFYGFGVLCEKDKIGKILQILEYMSTCSPEEKITFAKGIQGTHWEWSDRDREMITILPPYNEDSNFDFKLGGRQLAFSLPILAKDYQTEWGIETLGYLEGGIESAIMVPLPEVSEYQGDLTRMRDEMVVAIITGEKPLEYFDEYVTNYLAAGGQEIIDAANAWYAANKTK